MQEDIDGFLSLVLHLESLLFFKQEMLSKSRAGDTGVKLEVNERSV